MGGKNILFVSLNWGLGHAVRDIPLIKQLTENNYGVIIGGEGASGELLKKEFPQLKFETISSFKIKYPKSKYLILKLLFQTPKILKGIKKEHKQILYLLEKYNIDLIISDNRYGVYSKKTPSVFITHQISLQLPRRLKIFKKLILKIHKKQIEKFDLCLIPDYYGERNLSGKLSHISRLSGKYKYIGILSDFNETNRKNITFKYNIMVILSGPEPQRSILEQILRKQLQTYSGNVLIVSGKPDREFKNTENNFSFVNHLSRKEMKEAILSSEIIISRSGYTTIMDLVKLKKSAILIPTPGQTEQKYLAEYLKNKNLFVFKKQNNFNLKQSIYELKKLKPNFNYSESEEKDDFIKIINKIIN